MPGLSAGPTFAQSRIQVSFRLAVIGSDPKRLPEMTDCRLDLSPAGKEDAQVVVSLRVIRPQADGLAIGGFRFGRIFPFSPETSRQKPNLRIGRMELPKEPEARGRLIKLPLPDQRQGEIQKCLSSKTRPKLAKALSIRPRFA
jgi:hypothetical protein